MAVLQGTLPGTHFSPAAKVGDESEPAPTEAPVVPNPPPGSDDVSGRVHRRLIGSVGLVLPLLLYFIAAVAPNDPAHRWEWLGSVSSYYYTSGVVAFIGLLIALSLYLFAYQGYDNDWQGRDILWARIAAGAALCVATFPTSAPAGLEPRWWVEGTQWFHYLSAVALFSAFAVFCFKIFTLGPKPPDKYRAWQNRIYRACGVIIIGMMILAAVMGYLNMPIFWPEVGALGAFAVSWLVKGKIEKPIVEAIKKKT
jgi:MFS family permease